MWASTSTNEVGLVSYKLDVECEHRQVYSRREPKNVINVDDKTRCELRETWEVFYMETVKTAVCDRKLQQKQEYETYSSLTSLSAKSKAGDDTELVEQLQERGNVQKHDLPENDYSTVTDGGIQYNSRALPLSPEKSHVPTSESHMTVGSSRDDVGFVSHRLDVACENQQVYSKQKPKNVIHIVDVTFRELTERWKLFYSETVKTVVVDRTFHVNHESPINDHVQERDTAQRGHLPGSDGRSMDSEVLASDHGLPEKPSYLEPARLTVTPGQQQSEEMYDGTQPHEDRNNMDSGLYTLTVAHYKVDTISRENNAGVDTGVDTLQRDEYRPDTQPPDENKTGVDTRVDALPGDHRVVTEVPDEDKTGVDTRVHTVPGDHRVVTEVPDEDRIGVDTVPGDDQRLVRQPDEDKTGVNTRGDTLPDDHVVVTEVFDEDRTGVDTRVDTLPGDHRVVTAVPDEDGTGVKTVPGDQRVVTEVPDKDSIVVDTVPDDDQRLVTQPDEDKTGMATRVDTLPGYHRVVTQPSDEDKTGVDTRVDALPGDHIVVTEVPDKDRTGVDGGVDITLPDHHRLITEVPDEDSTGVDTVPDDGQRPVTQPPDDDKTGVDTRVDALAGDNRVVTVIPDEDRTGVDTVPDDDQRLVTLPFDENKTGVDTRVDTLPGGDHILDVQLPSAVAETAEVGEFGVVPPDVQESPQVEASDLDESPVGKPIRHMDTVRLSQSAQEVLSELEYEGGEGDVAVAKPLVSLDIKTSDEVTQQQPFSEVQFCIFFHDNSVVCCFTALYQSSMVITWIC